MTRIEISGEFDIDPGQTIRFDDPASPGFVDVTRRHDLPLVDVLNGGIVGAAYAMCVHPTFLKNRVWQHTDAWFDRLLGLGVQTIRGMFAPGNAGSRRVLELCIKHDVKWIATIIPEDGYDWTQNQVEDRARAVRRAIGDGARIDVELMNEPDHQRSGHPPVPSDWPGIMVRHAEWVREILPDVWLVSCSLHANPDNFERDWQRLDTVGLASLIDSVGIHDYDNGYEPCQNTDWRIGVAQAAMGDKPVDVTEYGHTTSINNPTNERNPTSLQAARLYAWRGFFDRVVTRNIRHACRFELLDDPDPANKITEAGFGVVDCPTLDPTTWSDKQEAAIIRTRLALTGRADLTFIPPPVRLRIDAGGAHIRHAVTQVPTKPPVLWLWRPDTRVWDPEARQDLTVPPVVVTVTTEHTVRRVDVAGGMATVELTEVTGGAS